MHPIEFRTKEESNLEFPTPIPKDYQLITKTHKHIFPCSFKILEYF